MAFIFTKTKGEAIFIRKNRLIVAVILSAITFTSGANAENNNGVQTTTINPNESQTIWSGWNVKGILHFRVASDTSTSCIDAWWNNMGFNSDKFVLCDGDFLNYSIQAYNFARLKVGWPQERTVVAVSGDAAVLTTPEICSRLNIDCL